MSSEATAASLSKPFWRLECEPTKMSDPATVHIIDDEADVRNAMELLLEGAGYRTRSYSSARAFFDAGDRDGHGCVITDLRMPEASGIDVLTRIQQDGGALPVVVVSAHKDVALAVHAMKKGAVDFIEKPFSAERLIEAVRAAVQKTERRPGEAPAKIGMAVLSKREHEVLARVLAGKSNRIIGQDLEISERTVESHRASIMRKTGARNLAELVRLVAAQG
jgi:two-component system response regulator FixJ